MTQNEKDLLLKDLCSRLPYGVKVNDTEGNTIDVVGIYKDAIIIPYAGITQTIQIDGCKLYLFPLSSMTREQEREWQSLMVCDIYGVFYHTIESFDYLYKNHIDIRGLIPMGLANDATGKNIY